MLKCLRCTNACLTCLQRLQDPSAMYRCLPDLSATLAGPVCDIQTFAGIYRRLQNPSATYRHLHDPSVMYKRLQALCVSVICL